MALVQEEDNVLSFVFGIKKDGIVRPFSSQDLEIIYYRLEEILLLLR